MQRLQFFLAMFCLALCAGFAFIVPERTASAQWDGCHIGYTRHAHLVSGNVQPVDCMMPVCHKVGQHTAGTRSGTLPLPPPFNTTFTATWNYQMVGELQTGEAACDANIAAGTFQ